MMKKICVGFLLLLAVVRCSNRDSVPSGVLPKQKMQEVIWDLTRTGEFLNNFVLNKDTSGDKLVLSKKWYDKVFSFHGIEEKDFERSYKYYQRHPKLLSEILDSLTKKPVYPVSTEEPGTVQNDSISSKVDTSIMDTRIRIKDSAIRKRIINRSPGLP